MARTITDRSVLVTGGAGFIGSHLVDRLLRERPARLVVADNLYLGRRENLAGAMRAAPGVVALAEIDATDLEAMERLVAREQTEVLFDLATIPLPASLQAPSWSSSVIVQLALVACELVRTQRVRTLVHCSSSEVYGTARAVPMSEDHPYAVETPYAAAKAAADLLVLSYVRTFGIDATIVRPFNAYGPRQNDREHAAVIPITIRRIQRMLPPVIAGDGEQTRDFTFVTDIAEGLWRSFEQELPPGTAVNIGSGRELSVAALMAALQRAMGTSLPIERVTERPGDVRRHLADITRARAMVGYAPHVDLDEGLAATVDYYRTVTADARAGTDP